MARGHKRTSNRHFVPAPHRRPDARAAAAAALGALDVAHRRRLRRDARAR